MVPFYDSTSSAAQARACNLAVEMREARAGPCLEHAASPCISLFMYHSQFCHGGGGTHALDVSRPHVSIKYCSLSSLSNDSFNF